MKKFFVMIVLVSTFFIGLGALSEQVGANLKSDAKALELIRLARIAIGGDANIHNVRSLTIGGNAAHFFENEGVQQTEQGTLEINLQLPTNQFSKIVRIGNSDGDGGNVQKKRVEIIVTKDGDGNVLTENVRGAKSDNDLKAAGARKIIIKKDDGSVQEINAGDKNVFFKKDGDTQTFKTDDGKTIVISKDIKTENISGNRGNELFRTTLALLLTAPQGVDVSYTFVGEENVDGSACSIVEAQTGGSSFKLYLDKSTFLPRMISYTGMDLPNIIKLNKPVGDSQPQEIRVLTRTSDDEAQVEHQIKFSDYRTVGGLLLPYRWSETVSGKPAQNIDIINYDINPANIADKFQSTKVFIRNVKPQ
ncbi:MAG: hypothetical protein ABI686_11010 [Acidobacteriota bacterium]